MKRLRALMIGSLFLFACAHSNSAPRADTPAGLASASDDGSRSVATSNDDGSPKTNSTASQSNGTNPAPAIAAADDGGKGKP